MTQPQNYSPTTDFEAELGSAHGTHLNAEFSNIRTTILAILTNLKLLQRDDTKLANLTVHPDSLTAATLSLLGAKWVPRGLWATAANYYVGDIVETSGCSYLCSSQHVSGVFATDHAAGKWIVIYQPISTAGLNGGMIAFSPTGSISATDVQNAIAEVANESLLKSLNFSDIANAATALANLGGMPKSGGSFTGVVGLAQGAAIAAAGTVDLSAATGNFVRVSGAATVSSFGTVAAGTKFVVEFNGVCTLVHDAAKLKLPGLANITTATGDIAEFVSLGAGNWKCLRFMPYAYLFNASYIASQMAQYVSQANGVNGAAIAFRNKIINGEMRVDQRNVGALQTFTAGAALAYCVDHWYGYCSGANVSGQRVAGSGATKNLYQFSGAASVTGIGFGQRIESYQATQLAGKTAVLSVDMANSILTTVNWSAYYANTNDAFGTLAAPTRTAIASGSFNVSSVMARQSVGINIPAAATTGIEIVFSVGSQTSGTWQIGNVQLEEGGQTPFERIRYDNDLAACQRYYFKPSTPMALGVTLNTSDGACSIVRFPVPMRATPTLDAGAAFTVASGTAGTPALRTGAGFSTNEYAAQLYNSAANWTASVAVSITAGFAAEIP